MGNSKDTTLPKLTEETIHNLSNPVFIKEIGGLVFKVPTKKTSCSDDFTDEFYQTLKGKKTIQLNLFQIQFMRSALP